MMPSIFIIGVLKFNVSSVNFTEIYDNKTTFISASQFPLGVPVAYSVEKDGKIVQHAELSCPVKCLTPCRKPGRYHYSQWGPSSANSVYQVIDPARPLFSDFCSYAGTGNWKFQCRCEHSLISCFVYIAHNQIYVPDHKLFAGSRREARSTEVSDD